MDYNTMLTKAIDKTRISKALGTANSGASSSWAWYESQIDLMSEANVYGSDKFSSSGFDTGIDNKQYALFQLKPEFINTNGDNLKFGYWLKNVSTSVAFTMVAGSGLSMIDNASNASSVGVRPRFLIG